MRGERSVSAPVSDPAIVAEAGGTAAEVLSAAGWGQPAAELTPSTPSPGPLDSPTRCDLLTELEGIVAQAKAAVARLSGLVDRMTHLRGQIAEQPARPSSANLTMGNGC